MRLERNVFGVLDGAARAPWRDREAFGFSGGESVSFVELRDRAQAFACGLLDLGLVRGDRVALMMNNRREWVETYFALAAAGFVSVPVNIMLVASEIDHVLGDSGARALVYDDYVAERIAQLDAPVEWAIGTGTTRTPRHAQRFVAYEAVIADADPARDIVGPDLHDPMTIIYTSGTTGRPKGAVHSHNGVLWNAMGQWNALGLDATVRSGVVSSLSWAAGMHVLGIALVWAGGSSHIRGLGGATAEAVVTMLVDERITHTFLPPSLLSEIACDPELLARLAKSRLRWLLTGSAPVPRTLLEIFADKVPDVALCQGMGLSEFPPVVVVLGADEAMDHVGSAGRPMPMSRVAVRTADQQVRSSGSGELLVRSMATMTGYWNRPEETAKAFRDGWLNTGDLADIDEDGYVTITGRLKELIISGGLNIYPREIEELLHRAPGVRECAVVGVPDPKFGETPAAVVVVESASEREAVERELRALCEQHLAPYKRPKHYVLSEQSLPRNSNGKILKRAIAPEVAADLGLATAD